MNDWPSILQIEKEPKVKDFGFAPKRVAADLRHANVYDDIIQIGRQVFAATNRRHSPTGEGSDYVPAFFWAPSINAILRGVYGDTEVPIDVVEQPPAELLIAPGKFSYGEIVEFAEITNMACSKQLTWAKPSYSVFPPVGISLTIDRFHYYFVCSEDESAEIKTWNAEQPIAIGFRPYKGKPLIG